MERFRSHLLAALLLALPLAFSSLTAEPFEPPKLFLLLVAALGLWAHRAVTGRPLAVLGPLTAIGWAAVGSAVLSTLFSMHWPSSVWGAPDSHAGLGAVAGTVTVFFAAQRLRPDGGWRWAVVLASGLVAAYGLVQYLGLDPLEWTRTATWCERVRPFSTLGHPNALAGYLAMTVPLSLVLGFASWAEGRRVRAACALGVAAAACAVTVATLSRAGWLALLAGGTVAAVGLARARALARRRALLALVLVGAGAVALSASGAFLSRARAFFDAPARRFIYEAAIRIFLDHPLLGSGVDTFQLAFQAHRPLGYWAHEWGATPQRAHDDLLQLLATQGLVGGAVALVGIAITFGSLRRAWRAPDFGVRLQAAGLGGCLAAAAVHGLFGFHVLGTATLAAVALGQLAALEGGEELAAAPDAAPLGRRRVRVALGLSILCFAGAWLVVRPLLASMAVRRAQEAGDDLAMAIDAYRDATRWMPFADTEWARLGVAAQEAAARDVERSAALCSVAEDALRRAVALSPRNAYHHANLGRFLGRADPNADFEQRRRDSTGAYDAAIARDPYNALLVLDAIETAVAIGDLLRAQRLVELLLASYPRLGPAWSWLGLIAQLQGRVQESRAFFQNAAAGDWHGDTAGQRAAYRHLEAALLAEGLQAEAERVRQEEALGSAESAQPAQCEGR